MLQERLSVSERRACRVTGQHRSTQRHRPRKSDRDDALRAELREWTDERGPVSGADLSRARW